GRASFLFQQNTAKSVPAAVRLVPYNSAYVARLADWEPNQKAALLHRAVDLNPFAAESWIQLGLSAEMEQRDVALAERYLLRAAEVDRMYLPKWTLTNFYFRQQRANEFFTWAKASLAISPFSPYPVFAEMWLFSPDAAKVASWIPDRPRILVQYAIFLADSHQFDAIPPIVQRLVIAAGSNDPAGNGRDGLIAPIEDRLLAAGELRGALQIWTSMKNGRWIDLPTPTPQRPLTNGDFRIPFFGHGFDWAPVASNGARVEQLADRKEVRITLSGMQPDNCALLQEYVPLDPNRFYHMQWRAAAQGMEGPTGLAWRLHAIRNNPSADLNSNDLLSSESGTWDFRPQAGTELFLLSLDYSRPIGNVRASGTVELPAISLKEQ
ncbi:MAG: hypothetical protein WB992_23920, partial [Bryobacteraceae bacterium]